MRDMEADELGLEQTLKIFVDGQRLSKRGEKLQDYCCEHGMPLGAIKADLSKQAPHNSYWPPMWYADKDVKGVHLDGQGPAALV